MKVKMDVGGQKLDFDMYAELNFDPEYVFDVLGKQPGQQAWWHALVAIKEQELSNYTAQVDKRTAELELEVRSDPKALEAQYGKVTESVIKAVVNSQDEILDMQERIHEIKRDMKILAAMTKGIDSRSVLLATAGSAQRAEIEARMRQAVRKAKKSLD